MTNGILDSSQKIITNGLVLNYDAAQLRSYPTTGNTITDLSGNGNNGTLVNGVAFDSGNGGSLVFDGINDYVNCGNSSLLSSSNITFSAWVKRTASFGNGACLFWAKASANYASTGYYIELYSPTGTNRATLIACNGNPASSSFIDSIPSNTSFPLNTWVNFTFTLNSNTPAMYFNGISSSLTILGTPAITSNNNIKYLLQNTYGNYTSANISQIQIYNRALSSTEVLQNYNANKSRYGL